MDPVNILAWIVLAFIALALAIFLGMILKVYIDQKLSDRKRKRAHAGKVRCEEREEPCQQIAVRVTPNGYFCGEHWQQNSQRAGAYATVSWGHVLNHAMKGRA